MRISAISKLRDIPALIPEFVSIPGWEAWKKRLGSLTQQAAKNPFLDTYFFERFAIELELGLLLERKKKTGRFELDLRKPRHYRLAAFVGKIVSVYRYLSPKAQNRLVGMLHDGLKTDKGLAPLETELTIAVHLMGKGFDVEFNDLETGGGFDYLATREGIEIEVECKNVSVDVGRPVHQRHVHQLGNVIYPSLNRKLECHPGGWFLKITLPDRLTGSHEQHANISKIVDMSLESDNDRSNNLCSVEIEPFALVDSPFNDRLPNSFSPEKALEFLDSRFGGSNKYNICVVKPRRAAAVVAVDSLKPDKVFEGIYRQLKDSSRDQLTGTRAGVIFARLEDPSSEDILKSTLLKRRATRLQALTDDVLRSRRHVYGVGYTVSGGLDYGREMFEGRIQNYVRVKEKLYFCRNAEHPLKDDPRIRVF